METMLRLGTAPNPKPIRMVADHVASPTYAPTLAARTLDLVERNCSGVFHAGGGTPISWFDYAALIFEAAASIPSCSRPTSASIARQRAGQNTPRYQMPRWKAKEWRPFRP
jgi:dTDP-4-dehydrorhamnose reductase